VTADHFGTPRAPPSVPNPSATTDCPACGATNEDHASVCHRCGTAIQETFASVRPARPFHLRTFGLAAATATLLLVVARIAGLTFSLSVLPAGASLSDNLREVEALARQDAIETADVLSLRAQLEREAELRDALDADRLPADEAMSARERLPAQDQASVIGTGGVIGLVPPIAALLLGAIVATLVGRTRRIGEVLAGVGIAAAVQVGTWLFAADFSVGAIVGGRTLLPRSFDGPVMMLLGMTIVLGMCGAAFAAGTLPRVIELFTARAVCVRCDHVIDLRPHAPEACPKCSEPLPERKGLRYRAGDDFLAELGPARVFGDANEALLCLRCAKTYVGACPVHPHEPLLDPTRDEVRFQLLDLDAQAGTRRFEQWTQAGLGIDAQGFGGEWTENSPSFEPGAAATPTGPLLCMRCAKTVNGERCPVHPDEPLLDPSREEVRLELIDADDRARGRMGTAVIVGAMVAALASAVGAGALTDYSGRLSVMVFAGVLIGLVTVGKVFVPRLAPPRFSQWTGEGQINLDEFGMGAEATIFAPLREAWADIKSNAIVLAVVVAAGAGLGAGVGLAIGFGAGLFALMGGVVALFGLCVVWAVRRQIRSAKEAVEAIRTEWNDPYAR